MCVRVMSVWGVVFVFGVCVYVYGMVCSELLPQGGYPVPVKYILYYITNAQLFYKLSRCYMFRHYRVILSELVINVLPSYTSISNADVKHLNCELYYQQLHLKYLCNVARY